MTWFTVYDSNTNSDFNPASGYVSSLNALVGGWIDIAGQVWKNPTVSAPVLFPPTGLAAGSLVNGTTYYYVITSVNAAGETTVSNQVSYTATTALASALLTWTPNLAANVTGYRIYRSTTSGSYGASALLIALSGFNNSGTTDTGTATTTGTPPSTNGTITGILKATSTGTGLTDAQVLARPQCEDTTDQRIVVNFSGAYISGSFQSVTAVLRWNRLVGNPAFQAYTFGVNQSGGLTCNYTVGTTNTSLVNQTYTFNAGHLYQLDASVTGTTVSVTLTDTTSSTVYGPFTATDTHLASGAMGLTDANAAGTLSMATRIQTFSAGSFTLTPNNWIMGQTVAVVAQGYGTSWVSGTTLSVAGGVSPAISSPVVNVGLQQISFNLATGNVLSVPTLATPTLTTGGTLTVGTAYSYVLTSLCNGVESVQSAQVTATPTSGNQSIVLNWTTAVAGATGYNLYRSTSSNTFTSPAFLVNVASGATITITDNGGTAVSAGTPPLTITNLLLTFSDSTDAFTSVFQVPQMLPIAVSGALAPGFWSTPLNTLLQPAANNGNGQLVMPSGGGYLYYQFTCTTTVNVVLNVNTNSIQAYGSSPLNIARATVGTVHALPSNTSLTGYIFSPYISSEVAPAAGSFTYNLSDTALNNNNLVPVATGLAPGTYLVVVYYRQQLQGTNYDVWAQLTNGSQGNGSQGMLVNGITISGVVTPSTPTLLPNNVLVLGDSRVFGTDNLSNGYGNSADHTQTAAFLLAAALKGEVNLVAYPSTGYTRGGITGTGVPSFPNFWSKFFNGQSRLNGSNQFVSQPTHIYILNMGINDSGASGSAVQAGVLAVLTPLRAAAPNAYIFLGAGSYDLWHTADVTAAYQSYQASTPDGRMFLLPTNLTLQQTLQFANVVAGYFTFDMTHPNLQQHAILATVLGMSTQALLYPQAPIIISG